MGSPQPCARVSIIPAVFSSPGFIMRGGNACGSKKFISLSSRHGSGELSKNEIFPVWAGWMDGWQWHGEGEMGGGELPGTGCGICPSSDPCCTGEMGNKELWPRLGKDQMQLDGCWTLHPLHPFCPLYTGTKVSQNPIIHLCRPHFSPSTNQDLKKN